MDFVALTGTEWFFASKAAISIASLHYYSLQSVAAIASESHYISRSIIYTSIIQIYRSFTSSMNVTYTIYHNHSQSPEKFHSAEILRT